MADGGDDSAFSVFFCFGDVLSSFGYDPAENFEGRQLLATSRQARLPPRRPP
jgi:hypothetical protein